MYSFLSPRVSTKFISMVNDLDYDGARAIAFRTINKFGSVTRQFKLQDLKESPTVLVYPPSRSVLYRLTPEQCDLLSRPGRLSTEFVISACYENDGDDMPSQIAYRAIESLETARSFLGSHVCATFLRWRLEQDILFLGMGLGNLKGADVPSNLKAKEDIFTSSDIFSTMFPPLWHNDANYPTILRNCEKRGLIASHWGVRAILDFTRAMLREY